MLWFDQKNKLPLTFFVHIFYLVFHSVAFQKKKKTLQYLLNWYPNVAKVNINIIASKMKKTTKHAIWYKQNAQQIGLLRWQWVNYSCFAYEAKRNRETHRKQNKTKQQRKNRYNSNNKAATNATVTMFYIEQQSRNASQVLLKCRYHLFSHIAAAAAVATLEIVKCHSFHKFIASVIYDAVLSGVACLFFIFINWRDKKREKWIIERDLSKRLETVIFGGKWMRTLLTIRKSDERKNSIRGNEVIIQVSDKSHSDVTQENVYLITQLFEYLSVEKRELEKKLYCRLTISGPNGSFAIQWNSQLVEIHR